MHCEKHKQVLSDCDKALSLDRAWLRAYLHKAKTLAALHKHAEAETVLLTGLNVGDPHQTGLVPDLKALRDECRQKLHFKKHEQNSMISEKKMAGADNVMLKTSRAREAAMAALTPEEKKRLQDILPRVLADTEAANSVLTQATEKESRGHYEHAIELFKQAATLGSTHAMFILGRIFHNGENGKPNHEEGIFWFKKCVTHGPCEVAKLTLGGYDNSLYMAQGCLGQAYRHGIGVEKDVGLATKYLKQASEGSSGSNGCTVGMNNYAVLLMEEHRQGAESIKWLTLSAENNYALAMVSLSDQMVAGVYMPRDLHAAETWLQKAQELGFPPASVRLAHLQKLKGGNGSEIIVALRMALEAETLNGTPNASTQLQLAEALIVAQEEEDARTSTHQIESQLRTHGHSLADQYEKSLAEQHRIDLVQLWLQTRIMTDKEEEACVLLQKAMNQGEARAGIVHGELLLTRGKRDRALEVFLDTVSKHDSDEALYHAGDILTQHGPLVNVPKGVKLLSRASKKGSVAATAKLNHLKHQQEYVSKVQI